MTFRRKIITFRKRIIIKGGITSWWGITIGRETLLKDVVIRKLMNLRASLFTMKMFIRMITLLR